MRHRSYDAYSHPHKGRRWLWWLLPLLLVLLACVGGLLAISPMLLAFWHTTHLSGLSPSFQTEFEALADLKIVESSDQTAESVNIVHSLTVTIPEDALEQMLNETLDRQPGRFIAITALTTRIMPDRIRIDLDVEYTLLNRVVFTTASTSEWQFRTAPALLAAPMPNVVELSPLTIRAAYWPSMEWTPLWQILTRQHAKNGWLPLAFTTAFRLEELILEDGELVLAIAPGTFL